MVELQTAIDLFLEKYLKPKQLSTRTLKEYSHELNRLAQFCLEHQLTHVPSEALPQIFDIYLQHRFINLSEKRRCVIISRFRSFFDFLQEQGVTAQNFEFILLQMPWAKQHFLQNVFIEQLKEMERMVRDLKQMGAIRKRFALIKKEVLKLGKYSLPFQAALLEHGLDKVRTMKTTLNEEFEQQLKETFWVGSVILNGGIQDLSNEMDSLNKNVAKLGREQYKFNTMDEARQESDKQFFEKLLNRISSTENFLADLAQFKRDTEDKINTDLVKEILPIIDGIEAALASIPKINQSASVPESASKGLFKALFTRTDESGSSQSIRFELGHWTEGLQIIHNRLISILKKRDISPIASIGQRFDPHLHIAVGIKYQEDIEEDIIGEEQVKGYARGNEIIRFAEVLVAKKKTEF